MTESDEWATVETVVEDDMDSTFERASSKRGPSGIEQSIFEQTLSVLISTNPWLLLFIALGVYYLVQKFRSSQVISSAEYSNLSADEILARQEAVELARRQMQEEYDKKAREHASKQKEKEELLRQEKLKNLEKYGTKLGRSSKTLATESSNDQLQQGVLKKKSDKPKLKPEYNPLMGDGSSGVCYRPTRRGGGAGGG
ncbi:selenoprotein S-like [Daphnia carinata]|uniref:selenoprotein S-like n=1 Tax=Daphnia carinata TaxID=120202 RepID=UPI00257FF66C|nr:selenoprotein S-like [Daphnia carinata]